MMCKPADIAGLKCIYHHHEYVHPHLPDMTSTDENIRAQQKDMIAFELLQRK